MKRRMSGSYTVEAALVMAVVLWTMAAIIQYAYSIGEKTKSAMFLHESLEKSRQEAEESTVTGNCQSGNWQLEIQMDSFHPEEFLRMTTLLDGLNTGTLKEE